MSHISRVEWPIDWDDDHYAGKLKVICSGAGFFIGRMLLDKHSEEIVDVCSRETDYYSTREEAEQALRDGTFEVRDCPENNWAYQSGKLPYPKAGGGVTLI